MIIDRYNDSKTHPIRYLKFCGIVPGDGSNPGPAQKYSENENWVIGTTKPFFFKSAFRIDLGLWEVPNPDNS